MADLSMVDIEAVVYALRSGSSRLKHTANTRGGNLCGPCPNCKGDDRFYVLPEATDSDGNRRGKWACRNCHPKEGDAIELLCFMEGVTEGAAFARLKEMYPELPGTRTPGRGAERQAAQVYRIKPLIENEIAPSAQWQKRARQLIEQASTWLWDDTIGAEARAYLRGRGLTDETIRSARLGYIPLASNGKEREDDAAKWGLDDRERLIFPSGILFPYEYRGDVWKLRARRLGDVEPDKRYRAIPGSSNGLYRADALRPNLPAMGVEGEIDALSIAQEVGNDITVVALGGTTQARIPKWVMRLALCSWVFLCLDNDEETSKTEGAASYWLKRLDNARLISYPEGYHDANDMLQKGADICAWLVDVINEHGLFLASETGAPLEPVKTGHFETLPEVEGSSSAPGAPQKAEKGKEKLSISDAEASAMPYDTFVQYAHNLASALTEETGVTWTANPLRPGQTIEEYQKEKAEAMRQADLNERKRLYEARMSSVRRKLAS